MDCSMPVFHVLHYLPKFAQTHSIESVTPSNHLILCCPLFFLPSVFPSSGIFLNESALRIRWPKYWSFSFSISPSNKYSELISFRIDRFDFLAVQGTPAPQLKSINSSALRWWTGKPGMLQSMGLQRVICDWATELNWTAFFMVQLLHPYMTTEKTIVLTIWAFVGKVRSLLFSMLSRLVLALIPRSNSLSI